MEKRLQSRNGTADNNEAMQVTITGVARNAMAGAVVVVATAEAEPRSVAETKDRPLGSQLEDLEGGPVYIEGRDSWDDAFDGKEVKVTGTLIKRSIAPQVRSLVICYCANIIRGSTLLSEICV